MNILTIARHSLKEAVRRRFVFAGVVLSLVYVALFAVGMSFIISNSSDRVPSARAQAGFQVGMSILTILGLYVVNFLTSFLALLVSVGSVSSEIESGTLHSVLARPIRRWEYIAGRWLAYAVLLVVYVTAMVSLILLTANRLGQYVPNDPVRAVAIMALEALFLLSLSLLGSTMFSTLANGVVVFSLFGLAWLAGIIEFVGSLLPNDGMVTTGIVVSLLVPSDALWRAASFYIQSDVVLASLPISGGAAIFAANVPPSPAMIAWGVLYTAAVAVSAAFVFRRRDL